MQEPSLAWDADEAQSTTVISRPSAIPVFTRDRSEKVFWRALFEAQTSLACPVSGTLADLVHGRHDASFRS